MMTIWLCRGVKTPQNSFEQCWEYLVKPPFPYRSPHLRAFATVEHSSFFDYTFDSALSHIGPSSKALNLSHCYESPF